MNYPNSKKNISENHAKVSAANRGRALEDEINEMNSYYLKNDIAIIHKKPTPITVVKVDYPKRTAAKITEAYYKLPSTTDYNGIYKNRYVDFEAKECRSRTAFPFSSIHPHQIEHLDGVMRHGAIAFILLRMVLYDEDYLIKADEFITYYRNCNRKSITYDWIKEHGHLIRYNYIKPCDYLKVVDEVYEL